MKLIITIVAVCAAAVVAEPEPFKVLGFTFGDALEGGAIVEHGEHRWCDDLWALASEDGVFSVLCSRKDLTQWKHRLTDRYGEPHIKNDTSMLLWCLDNGVLILLHDPEGFNPNANVRWLLFDDGCPVPANGGLKELLDYAIVANNRWVEYGRRVMAEHERADEEDF